MQTLDTKRPIQKRTLETRSRLLKAARTVLGENGYAGFRVEDVVARAAVAKGTFFAHFRDKDALFDLLIGEDIDRYLDELQARPSPQSVDDVVEAMLPMSEYMAADRLRFDIVLRYSGAAAIEEIGPIAMTFCRRDEILNRWLTGAPFRRDIPIQLLAEGIDAFVIQSVAMCYCAVNARQMTLRERLQSFFFAWLIPETD